MNLRATDAKGDYTRAKQYKSLILARFFIGFHIIVESFHNIIVDVVLISYCAI